MYNMDKILKIQSEIGVLVKTETNPFFKSKYMDINGLLEQLLPLLEKHKLTVIQPLGVTGVNDRACILTEVIDAETGNSLVKSFFPLPDIQDPQKMGSAITYYRRYALQSLFLLRAEDDDGNGTKKKDEPELTLFEKAKKDLQAEEEIFSLRVLEDKIKKSSKLTDKEKQELSFIANEVALTLDPTK